MSRNHSFGYLFTTACGLAILGVMSTTAEAITTTIFADIFEQGTVGSSWDNGTQPGAWVLNGAPLVTNAGSPGPFEGTQYGFIERNLVDSFDVARAEFTPVNSGRLDLDTMVRIPGTQEWLSIILGNDLSSNPNSPDANVHSYVVFHLNSTHNVAENARPVSEFTGFQYKNNEWMRLQVGYDYANAATGYTVKLTTTDGTFTYTNSLLNSSVEIDTMAIKFEDNANSAFLDALTITHTVIPEPSCLMLLGIGGIMTLASARRRAAMRGRLN